MSEKTIISKRITAINETKPKVMKKGKPALPKPGKKPSATVVERRGIMPPNATIDTRRNQRNGQLRRDCNIYKMKLTRARMTTKILRTIQKKAKMIPRVPPITTRRQ